MAGIITSIPPLVEQPPGNSSSNPAGLPGVTYTAAIPILPQTWTGLQTFNTGSVQYAGSISGFVSVNGGAVASGAVSFPAIVGADILLANNNTATIKNKSIDGLQNTLTNIPAAAFGSTTGTGPVVLQNIPTIVSPLISGATITTSTYNGNIWTAGTGTLTLGAGKTATISNTLTFTGTDASSIAFGAGGTVAYQGSTLAQFAATTSAQLAGVLSDETGTGSAVFANGPTLIAPLLGTPASGVATNLTGTAPGLTAGNVTTNANLTGPITSVGNATAIGANQVTRAMEAQGIARSIIGVTGNASANVADIQGAASQFLGVNAAGTALAFQTMTTDVTLSGPAATISANAVTNAKMATMAAWTFKANATSGAATPTDITIDGLTLKASPAAGDEIFIWDVAGTAVKKTTVSALASAGSVASLNGQTGALAALILPQGRLTLTSGVARPTADVSGATTVYYTPAAGFQVPIYDGTNFVPTTFSQLSQLTTDATKSPAAVTTNSNYDIFVWNDAGTIRATRGPAWTSDGVIGAGAGTSERVLVNGILLNANAITNGPAAQRGTYVGTIRSNGTSTIDFTFGTTAAAGGPAVFGVWNAYNQILFNAQVGDNSASWTYSLATVRSMNNSAGNRVSFVSGLKTMPISVSRGYWAQTGAVAGSFAVLGFALNATNVVDRRAFVYTQTAAVLVAQSTVCGNYPPQLGFGFIQATEGGDGSTTFTTAGTAQFVYFEVTAWQ